ncbi:hypothetical protein GQ44DRAFT_783986 [Phaeosphaeriaceae sp. PMI808]|nr:hypothetical protein GQ44DRAFT_783986 [Phaeosphaeriaceae sp. PMI808]
MDKASRVLSQGLPSSVPVSYRALADHGNVPRSTLHSREEDALVKFFLQMSDLG